ncbi:MAG: hypothetical protein JWP12_54 [Bacteroidetes bacterium]|nr:hypothetical protein [Bacteroidota bacterium]
MSKEKRRPSLDEIIVGMKAAVHKVYMDAYKDGTELVVSGKNGGVDWVKVVSVKNGKFELVKVR